MVCLLVSFTHTTMVVGTISRVSPFSSSTLAVVARALYLRMTSLCIHDARRHGFRRVLHHLTRSNQFSLLSTRRHKLWAAHQPDAMQQRHR
mmetsp:Transcript_17610/g.49822  ORF Transcript_17610/g.49822 Transcript_17610/m.49822 type:complete len:91 (-) Transcript_17610:430-702(-)